MLIPAAASMLQSGMNAQQQQNNANQNFGQNLMLSQYQYSNELDMWNKANAYNSPSAQMQRLKDAGLNPNLMYGQGNTGNTANQLPRYQAPTYHQDVDPSVDLPSALSQYQDFRIKDAQVSNMEAQRNNIQAETLIKALQAKAIAAQNWYNFGNRDFKDWTNTTDRQGNYYNKNVISTSQADVASQTVNDMINKIRLSNQTAESMIPNINARTDYTNLLSQYQSSINKFATGSQIGKIISNLVPLLRLH